MPSRLTALYHLRSQPRGIAARAQAIAIEQSVEMPLPAIEDAGILRDVVGKVEDIEPLGGTLFAVRIGLATSTVGTDGGQLMNMLFGNTSIHDDVELIDVQFPGEFIRAFPGPGHGMDGLRKRVGATNRALSCAALKPQGLSALQLAALGERLALGRIDYIKDDHGLADQIASPFAERVVACAGAIRRAARQTGHATRYVPSLSGSFQNMQRQIRLAREEGIDTVLVAPMICGLSNFQALTTENREIAFIAHPALAGASRIAPPLLLGRLFRLLGADAVIFPNHGGRFGYSPGICRAIAQTARVTWQHLAPSLPVPAGGMRLDRVPEILSFYGPGVMVLIGGDLLAAGDNLTREAAAFGAALCQGSMEVRDAD